MPDEWDYLEHAKSHLTYEDKRTVTPEHRFAVSVYVAGHILPYTLLSSASQTQAIEQAREYATHGVLIPNLDGFRLVPPSQIVDILINPEEDRWTSS